jgi:hypothetical protein
MSEKIEVSEKIKAEEISLGGLFSENFIFNIPIYQRPFSWTVDNFDDLFEDILSAMEANLEQCFLGPILLQQIGKNCYDVVDGQQRITAITILLAIIRDNTTDAKLKNKINSYLYQEEDRWKEIPAVMRMTPWSELKALFEEYIYKTDGTKRFIANFGNQVKCKDQEDPKYHIYEAIGVFNGKLSKVVDTDKFVKYLLNKVYMVYIMTNRRASAFRLFRVLNARGLPLDPSDLLKSENLEAVPDAKRDEYARIWRTIEEELGREELGEIIAFIRTILTKEKAKFGIYEEFQQIFEKRLLSRGPPFIDYLKQVVDIYEDKILEPRLDLDDARAKNDYKITIDLMRRFIPYSDWVPPLLALFYKFKSDDDLPEFLQKLEKKTVLEWTIGFSPTERITSLNKIIELVSKAKDAKEVVDKIEIPGRASDKRAFLDKVNDPQLYSIYAGKLVKYLLLRIDKELWELENFPGYPGTVTIEHVLPQTPTENSEWIKAFNDEDKQELTNKLGNLVLLSGRKNSSAQNFEFDRKKSVYFKEKGTAFRITQELKEYPKWDPQTLKSRHEKLVGLVTKIFFV